MAIAAAGDGITWVDELGAVRQGVVVKAVPSRDGLPATGLTPVAATIAAPGSTAGLVLKAGRTAYLYLSGGTSASGSFEYSKDGTNWFPLVIEGTKVGTFTYVGSNQKIVVPSDDEAGMQVRATFSAVSGTITYSLEQ